MGNVFLHGKGGAGGAGLNFKVVGGTTAPSNPKENMIWINTDVKITSWVFSATQPTAESGKVWISTGTSSTVEFNALKKNGIQVYPLFAKQYVNGAWVDKPAKSYQNGKWVDWINYIYNKGEEKYTFAAKGMLKKSGDSGGTKTPTITRNADNIYFVETKSNASGDSGIVYTTEKIDLSNVSTLCVEGDFYTDYNTTYPFLSLWSSIGTYFESNAVATKKALVSATKTEETHFVQLDVSELTGSYHIGFVFYAANSKCYARIRQMYLK